MQDGLLPLRLLRVLQRRRRHHAGSSRAAPLALAALLASLPALAAPGEDGEEILASQVAGVPGDIRSSLLLERARALARAGHHEQASRLIGEAIADEPGTLASLDGIHFRPARRIGQDLLLSLPGDVLRHYREEADRALAERLADLGDRPDPEALLSLSERALAATGGPAVLERAAVVAWDRGDLRVAIRAWEILLTAPDGLAVDRDLCLARIALAEARRGRRQEALEALDRLSRRSPGWTVRLGGAEATIHDVRRLASDLLRERPGVARPGSHTAWTVPPVESGEGAPPGDAPLELLWRRPLRSDGDPLRPRDVLEYPALPYHRSLPGNAAAVHDGRVVIRDGSRLLELALRGGDERWSREMERPLWRITPLRRRRITALCLGPMNYGEASVTVTDAAVLVVDGPGHVPPTHRQVLGLGRCHHENDLVALEPGTGRVLWNRRWEGIGLRSAPILHEGRLYAHAERPGGVLLLCLDPARGRLLWATPVASTNGYRDLPYDLPPTARDGLVIVPTNAGILAAVDAATGQLRWATLYARHAPRVRDPSLTVIRAGNVLASATIRSARDHGGNWAPSPPVIRDGRVFVAPSDGRHLLALDLRTGRTLWRREKEEGSTHLLGASAGSVIIGGERIVAYGATDGVLRWEWFLDEPLYGRGFTAGNRVIVPGEGQVHLFDGGDGTWKGAVPLPKTSGVGNLLPVGGDILAVTERDVSLYGVR